MERRSSKEAGGCTGDGPHEDAHQVGERRRFLRSVARKAKRAAGTGPAVALLLGAGSKAALASSMGGGCGCAAGLPGAGDSVDGVEAHFTAPGGTFEGELLNTGDDWDWLTFSAVAGDQITLTLEAINGTTTGLPLGDPEIALYRDIGDGLPGAGDLVGTDLDLLTSADLAINGFVIPADGTYIAVVAEGLNGTSDNRGGYRANVSIVPEPGTATLLGAGLAFLGRLRRQLRNRA